MSAASLFTLGNAASTEMMCWLARGTDALPRGVPVQGLLSVALPLLRPPLPLRRPIQLQLKAPQPLLTLLQLLSTADTA